VKILSAGSGLKMKANHSGGFLKFIIPMASVLGALIRGGTATANSVTNAKHKKVEEEKKIAQKAKIISVGSGLKKNFQPLTDHDISNLAKDLGIRILEAFL
jgi:hypothetical protein